MEDSLARLLEEVRACRVCEDELPLGAKPCVRGAVSAKLLVVGQAPGTVAHETGLTWNDASGDRLRSWMGVDRDTFYDESRVAIVPMAYCYPGRHGRGGDLPPRKECAELWLERLLAHLPYRSLTLLIGQYAQAYYLGACRKKNLTETVRAWREYVPEFLPLPHPSWRNNRWLSEHPWFEEEVIPDLQGRVAGLIGKA